MEQFALKDLTLTLFERCCEAIDFPAGLAVQAYLRSGMDDIDRVIAWARRTGRQVTVRLIKGAYWQYAAVTGKEFCPFLTCAIRSTQRGLCLTFPASPWFAGRGPCCCRRSSAICSLRGSSAARMNISKAASARRVERTKPTCPNCFRDFEVGGRRRQFRPGGTIDGSPAIHRRGGGNIQRQSVP